jgi:hypothetical protein
VGGSFLIFFLYIGLNYKWAFIGIIQSSLGSWWILGFFEFSNGSLEHLAIVNFTRVY